MKSQNERVLEYIRANGDITTYQAFQDLHITRLSARIWDLRNKGYRIGSKQITKNQMTYYRYFLKECENEQKNL